MLIRIPVAKFFHVILFALLFFPSCTDSDEGAIDGDGADGDVLDGDVTDTDHDGDPVADGDGNENEEEEPEAPSDDPADWVVDTSVDYEMKVSEHRWVVPSDTLPKRVEPDTANNNLDIQFHGERLFFAWRSAPTHFASEDVRMIIVSSPDEGQSWDFEYEIHMGADMREPRLLSFGGELTLYYFEAGVELINFAPVRLWRTKRLGPGEWSEPEIAVDQPEVPWDMKVRNGRAYLTSYMGNHYDVTADSAVEIYFKVSDDGLNFEKIDEKDYVFKGGSSEAAFEFDEDGNLWAVLRNEDGDETGFGSLLCTAASENLSDWQCPDKSDPERYDSPEMFRHGEDIYLVARRDVDGPYDQGLDELDFEEQKSKYLFDYSLRPKRSAIYKIDREEKKVVHLQDIPGCGDTAFPSIRRTGPHSFLLANYTSPLDDCDINWMHGQSSSRGTQIYFIEIEFKVKPAGGK